MKIILIGFYLLSSAGLSFAGDSYLECSWLKGGEWQDVSVSEYFDRDVESSVSLTFGVPDTDEFVFVTLDFTPAVSAIYTWKRCYGSNQDCEGPRSFLTDARHYDPVTVYEEDNGQSSVICQLVD